VVACGGGVVVAESNRRLMRDRGYVINLSASLDAVLKRLVGATDRPLYSGKDAVNRVQKLMDERKQFYADADIRIDTDNKSVEDVVSEILKVLRELQA
jgi:shikimate kinase